MSTPAASDKNSALVLQLFLLKYLSKFQCDIESFMVTQYRLCLSLHDKQGIFSYKTEQEELIDYPPMSNIDQGTSNYERLYFDLKFPGSCLSHSYPNALPWGQKNIIFTVFATKTAKPYLMIP